MVLFLSVLPSNLDCEDIQVGLEKTVSLACTWAMSLVRRVFELDLGCAWHCLRDIHGIAWNHSQEVPLKTYWILPDHCGPPVVALELLFPPLELLIPPLELFICPLKLCGEALEHRMLVKRTTSCTLLFGRWNFSFLRWSFSFARWNSAVRRWSAKCL